MSRLRWSIMGLSEVRREGEDTITLKSGNLLYYREGDQLSQGGVGFLVHRSLINNIITIGSVSSRVAYLILRVSKRYSLKVIQVYAPTSKHPDEEVEVMYEDISRAIHKSKTYFNVSTLRPINTHIPCPESFQLELSNRFECLQSCQSVDEINNRFVETVQAVGSKFFRPRRRDRPQKLSDHTLNLMAERRSMVLQTSVDAKAFRQLNRRISRSLRRDIRNFNTNCIEEAIERNKGSKVFARDVSVGQSQLTKLKTDDGRIASTKAEVLREIENFYGQLYTSVALPVSSSTVDPRAKLTRHYTEDIPDISLYEIRMALKQLKNNKAPGEDGITSELLQAGGTPVLKVLQKLFNSVLLEGITPEAWNRSVVVLFFKKGDNTLLKNYRRRFTSCFQGSSRIVSHAGSMTSSLPNKPASEKALAP
ncbi:hypothetical protein ABMA27_002461 [Loxostege sticticalis]|uniref:Uncharacterized protein n=1 Tax=Loxostege sticticalis TaxID=481309 RepID=A0ABR3HTS9_LOXSC